MNILDSIMAERRADVEAARRQVPPDELHEAADSRVHHSLAARLLEPKGTHIIAEIKRASPSAGLLRPDYRPARIAEAYAAAGAAAISVLTEPRHFMGDGGHLRAVREAVGIPVLRKDFVCDEYQVLEAAAWGADVILLIVAALEEEDLQRLCAAALGLGLEVLVEAHEEHELRMALSLTDAIVGINSRNLKTLKKDLSVAQGMAKHIPEGCLSIAESGISNRADIEALSAAGYRGFLVGETLMRDEDPGRVLQELLGGNL
jgi:indole-3-glycerol phosphate synthase